MVEGIGGFFVGGEGARAKRVGGGVDGAEVVARVGETGLVAGKELGEGIAGDGGCARTRLKHLSISERRSHDRIRR